MAMGSPLSHVCDVTESSRLVCMPINAFQNVFIGGLQVFFKQICVLKLGQCPLKSFTWNNGIGCLFYFVLPFESEVIIKRNRRERLFGCTRGEINEPLTNKLKRKYSSRMLSLVMSKGHRLEDDQISSQF